jgi:hypothetical protein
VFSHKKTFTLAEHKTYKYKRKGYITCIFTHSRDTAYNPHYNVPPRQASLPLCLPIMVIQNLYTDLFVPWCHPHDHNMHSVLTWKTINFFSLHSKFLFIHSRHTVRRNFRMETQKIFDCWRNIWDHKIYILTADTLITNSSHIKQKQYVVEVKETCVKWGGYMILTHRWENNF